MNEGFRSRFLRILAGSGRAPSAMVTLLKKKRGSGGFFPQGFDFKKQKILKIICLKSKPWGKNPPDPFFFLKSVHLETGVVRTRTSLNRHKEHDDHAAAPEHRTEIAQRAGAP
ncbi:MAG: hypothetical protein HQL91_09170 [Magnetococcales bacterium]|nr:hypothetical protein [Magnetococcales bacterium]